MPQCGPAQPGPSRGSVAPGRGEAAPPRCVRRRPRARRGGGVAAGAGGGAAPSLAMSEVPAFGRRRRLRDAGRERPQRGSAGGSGGWDGPGQDQRQGQRGGAAAAAAAAAVGRAAPGPLLPLHLHGRPLQPPAREPGPAGAQVGPGPGAAKGQGSGVAPGRWLRTAGPWRARSPPRLGSGGGER